MSYATLDYLWIYILSFRSLSGLQTTWHTMVLDFYDGSLDLDCQTKFSQDLYLKANPRRKSVQQPHFLAGSSHWCIFLSLSESNETNESFNSRFTFVHGWLALIERPFSITTDVSYFKCKLLHAGYFSSVLCRIKLLGSQQIWFALGKDIRHIAFHSSFYILIIRSPYPGSEPQGFAGCKISVYDIKIFPKVHFISSLQSHLMKGVILVNSLWSQSFLKALISLRMSQCNVRCWHLRVAALLYIVIGWMPIKNIIRLSM